MRSARLLLTPVLPLLALALLVGCSPEPAPAPSDSSSADPESPTPTPSESAPSDDAGPAVDIACDQLISNDTMYAFNPNYALLDSLDPGSGNPQADALAADGAACRWEHTSNGSDIDLAVQGFGVAALSDAKDAAFAQSEMVPTYDVDEGYFAAADNVGTAIGFVGSYRIVLTSPEFFEPGEVTSLMNSVAGALK